MGMMAGSPYTVAEEEKIMFREQELILDGYGIKR